MHLVARFAGKTEEVWANILGDRRAVEASLAVRFSQVVSTVIRALLALDGHSLIDQSLGDSDLVLLFWYVRMDTGKLDVSKYPWFFSLRRVSRDRGWDVTSFTNSELIRRGGC